MSYARWSEDCDLYIYQDASTDRYRCRVCSLTEDGEFWCDTRQEMIIHVEVHAAVGDLVGTAIDQLRQGDCGEEPL